MDRNQIIRINQCPFKTLNPIDETPGTKDYCTGGELNSKPYYEGSHFKP
ncbi:MAG: hypothetical protein IH886_14965 [Nitrospinae bacterium]|nr:hypothetical protein [Nitrospinota bacterium]